MTSFHVEMELAHYDVSMTSFHVEMELAHHDVCVC